MAAKDVAAHQLARIHSATIGIVAERGYEALKVRDVVSYAEVSTRAFYELFGSKEDCFSQTYDLIARRAARRILAAQAGEPDWRERSRLIFEEFLRGLEQRPADARLALIEIYEAGETSLERAWRAERVFEGMLAECFARSPDGVVVPPLVIEGVVAGIAAVSRTHLQTGTLSELRAARDDLLDWSLSYADEAASELAALDRGSIWRDTTHEPLPAGPTKGDRALIIAAVAELAARNGYSRLTAARVRSAAGVSRKKFDAYFEDLEDCYLAALEQKAADALAQAARAQTAASGWAGGVYRAISALCGQVASDRFLATVCLTGDFPPGPDATRSRQRLLDAITELLSDPVHQTTPATPSRIAASSGAIWSLFHHHVIRDAPLHRQIAATLSYLALAPAIGASAAIAAIQSEQQA
jgi:AcrR family transcriptional regulator